jgi:hypothetical protein
MSKKNIHVLCGSKDGGEYRVLATYSNYESALRAAKYYVGDVLGVVETENMTHVHGEYSDAEIEMFLLKEEFDDE